MEVLLFNHDYYNLRYNCSFYNVDKIPVEKRQHRFLGTVLLISYFVCMTAYCICLATMLTMNNRNRASYKLMILLGFVHIIGLQTSGLLSGIFSIQGAVFCTNPLTIYIGGGVAVSTWMGSTALSMILGLNRCFELYDARLAYRLFGGKNLLPWIITPVIYMLYTFIFTPPPIFNGIMVAAFYNPHYMYFDDYGEVYYNRLHTFNNFCVCLTESIIYGTLIVLYLRATRETSSSTTQRAFKREKKIYVQVILIGIIHFNASASYIIVEHMPVNFYTSLIASTFYLLSQGFPPFIYLCVNRTLRNAIRNRMGLAKRNSVSTASSIVLTHSNMMRSRG